MILDLRILSDRDGVLRASIDGRRVVGLPATSDVAVLLAELARRVDGAAWRSGRSTLAEVADAASTLYAGEGAA